MIEPGIRKVRGDMACRTVLCRRQVVDMLACRRYAIMAGHTVVCDTGVIEHRGHEGTAGHVADIAILGRRHVIRLGALTDGDEIVMAGITTLAHDVRPAVIHECTDECGRVVADTAIGAGCRMVERGILADRTYRGMVAAAVVA